MPYDQDHFKLASIRRRAIRTWGIDFRKSAQVSSHLIRKFEKKNTKEKSFDCGKF